MQPERYAKLGLKLWYFLFSDSQSCLKLKDGMSMFSSSSLFLFVPKGFNTQEPKRGGAWQPKWVAEAVKKY
jgi:hypothetical protein